ncbi:MAG: hypothetical protein K2K72_07400, partial [Duncaniella sp.]|nr:hypothetical protein [Duncaniella sp.]
YTLEEIRYARAYTAARKEINSERLNARLRSVSEKGFIQGSPTSLISKLLGAFSYIDIALIAWKFGSRIFKFTRALRR